MKDVPMCTVTFAMLLAACVQGNQGSRRFSNDVGQLFRPQAKLRDALIRQATPTPPECLCFPNVTSTSLGTTTQVVTLNTTSSELLTSPNATTSSLGSTSNSMTSAVSTSTGGPTTVPTTTISNMTSTRAGTVTGGNTTQAGTTTGNLGTTVSDFMSTVGTNVTSTDGLNSTSATGSNSTINMAPTSSNTSGPQSTSTVGPSSMTTAASNSTSFSGPQSTSTTGSISTTVELSSATVELSSTTVELSSTSTVDPQSTSAVGSNSTTTVGSNSTTTVGSNSTTTVGSNSTTTVGSNFTSFTGPGSSSDTTTAAVPTTTTGEIPCVSFDSSVPLQCPPDNRTGVITHEILFNPLSVNNCSFDLTSPEFDPPGSKYRNAPPNQTYKCVYNFRSVVPTARIRASFEQDEFELPGDRNDCSVLEDHVRVEPLRRDPTSLLLCGTFNRGRPFSSQGNEFKIEFFADDDKRATGFRFVVEAFFDPTKK